MSNQASELFELCKKVYELTEWGDMQNRSHTWTKINEKNKPQSLCPLYTSDYLLEKLPEYVIEYDSYYEQDISNYLCVMKVPDGYVALYDGLSLAHKVKVQRADTPLKALLKLTIALSEAGELDNE